MIGQGTQDNRIGAAPEGVAPSLSDSAGWCRPRTVGVFCFKAAQGGSIVDAQRKRFELRTLAEQQATIESGAFRALLRQAELATNQDRVAGKKEEQVVV